MMKRKKRYVAYYDGTLDDETLDPELASHERDGLMSKEDKVKLDRLIDNNSPVKINATQVICDSEHRFVTDTEKVVWNSKAPNILATTKNPGLMSAQDKSLLDALSGNGGSNSPIPIKLPATNVICDSEHRFVSDTLIAKLESVPSTHDENVFTFNDDGSLNLRGFNEAEPGAQLVKGADGKVLWVKPNETTIEGMQTIIAELHEDVTNLTTIVNNKVDAVEGKGLSTHDLTDELLAKINASSASTIEIIKLAGTALPIEDKVVNIPMATTTTLGLVKASDSVRINDDGSLEVDNINVNNLTQSEGEYFVLTSGTSEQFV